MAGETPPYSGIYNNTNIDSSSNSSHDRDPKLDGIVAAFRERLRLDSEFTVGRTVVETDTTATQGELMPQTDAVPQEAWNEFAKQAHDKSRLQIYPNSAVPQLHKDKKTLSEPHSAKTTGQYGWVVRQRTEPKPQQVMLDIDSPPTADSEDSTVAANRGPSIGSRAASLGLSTSKASKPSANDPVLVDIQVYSAEIPDRTQILFQGSTSTTTILPTKMHIGYLRSESEYVKMLTAERTGYGRIPEICTSDSRLVIKFRYKLTCGNEKLFRVSTPLANILEITETAYESCDSSVVMSLASPPKVFILDSSTNHRTYRSSNVQFSKAHHGPVSLHATGDPITQFT